MARNVLRPRFLATLLVLVAGAAQAAHTGGLAVPVGAGGLAVSTTLGYAERDVENGRNDEATSRRLLVRAEFGLLANLDLYALFGLTDVEFQHLNFEGDLRESLGAGVRWSVLQLPDPALQFVLDLQGETFRSEDGARTARCQAYHLAAYAVREIGAAGRVGYFYPYGGLRLSYADYDLNRGASDHSSDDFLGVFGGVDYFVNPNVYFSGEAHLFDETSLYLGVGYRF